MTPAIVDLVITSYFLPYIKPDASTVYFCLSPLNFCADLFYTSPMMYVLLYVIWGGVIGGIISIICCLLGIVLKNNIFAFGFLSVFLMMNKEICDLNQWEGYCYYYLVNPGQPVEQLEGADFIRLIAGLIIIIAGSIWKIVLINTEYSQPSIEEKCMGEVIAITPDVDFKVLSMRIQSIDNINCDEKTKKAIKEIGENVKVANIEVEIKNQGSKDNLIKIYDWVLQNKVWSNGINMELFYGENEKNIDLEILLEKTTCKKIILPFLIYDFQMKKSQWDTLNSQDFQLVLEHYPVKKIVKMIK